MFACTSHIYLICNSLVMVPFGYFDMGLQSIIYPFLIEYFLNLKNNNSFAVDHAKDLKQTRVGSVAMISAITQADDYEQKLGSGLFFSHHHE